ncbi:MAG: class I SAM-dependent methyltransferase [Alphaproteobacteria bacterium]|nr:MAG: class I SAM-dependent methyltransferase [Alphaproteobacteria bacterium]
MNIHEQTLSRNAWNAIAVGYDEFVTPTHMWLANQGLRRVGLKPGMRFLDVAAGSGALSIPAARSGAQVLSVDISPVMVEQLTARARKEGLGLEARVMDGHALELEDNTFDICGSQYGVMLFPDLPRGLSEMVRVTKPGGKVLLHAYGPPQEIEFLGFFMAAMQAAVPDFSGLPTDPVPLPFQVADPEKLRRELIGAGLKEVKVETVTEELKFGTGKEMWDWVVNSNPIPRMIIADLTPEQEGVVQRSLDDRLRERSGGSGSAVLTNPVHIGTGTK